MNFRKILLNLPQMLFTRFIKFTNKITYHCFLSFFLCYLGFPSALQDVHQGTSHLLFVLDTDRWFQHRAEQHVVVGSIFSKLLIHLHWKDVHTLVARLYPDRRSRRLPLPWVRCVNGVPLLNKLSTGHTFYWDVYQSHIVVLVFFLLLVRVPVDVDSDVLDSRQVGELKVLSPEDVVCFQLAGGAGIKGIIQAELAEVLLLGR